MNVLPHALLTLACACAAPALAQSATLEALRWVGEDAPPYHFSKDGMPTGVAIDVLAGMWQTLGVPRQAADVQILPWARAYYMALNQPGTCIFTTVATAEQKRQLAFVGPLFDTRLSIIAPTQGPTAIADLRELDRLTVGVVRDGSAEQALAAAGVSPTLIRTDSPRTLIRMLAGGRFDAIAYEAPAAAWTMRAEDVVTSAYRPVLTLFDGVAGYACHRDTDPALLAQLRGALEQLHADGTIERIHRQYQR